MVDIFEQQYQLYPDMIIKKGENDTRETFKLNNRKQTDKSKIK